MATGQTAATTARRRPPLGVLLLAIVLGLAGGVLALEAGVRAFVPVSDFFWEWDAHVGLKLIPGKHGRAVKKGVFDAPVAINSHGFRDREHAYPKRPGVKRVVVLGDSFTEALQVPFEQSVTPLLEAELKRLGHDVELINLGISGFGTGREYLMLREYGLRYQPDVVLLFFVGNDISDNSRRLQGLPHVPYPVPNGGGTVARDAAGQPVFTAFADRTSRLGPVAGFLREHFKTYRLLREAIDASPNLNRVLYRLRLVSTPPEPVNTPGATTLGYYEIYRAQYREPWAEAWALTEDLMVATNDLARAHGAAFGVVLVPSAWEVYPDWLDAVRARIPAMREVALDLDKPTRRLGAFLGERRIPHVALLTPFRAVAAERPPLYILGDSHWSAEGHRLAAALLAGRVAELLGKPSLVTARDRNVR